MMILTLGFHDSLVWKAPEALGSHNWPSGAKLCGAYDNRELILKGAVDTGESILPSVFNNKESRHPYDFETAESFYCFILCNIKHFIHTFNQKAVQL